MTLGLCSPETAREPSKEDVAPQGRGCGGAISEYQSAWHLGSHPIFSISQPG